MFNLFKGGKKGRLFNNPKKIGEGGSRMKKGIVLVVALLGVLTLVGWGCDQRTATPTDTGTDTNVSETTPEAINEVVGEVPAGWTEYRNERFGFSFQYPEEWRVLTFDDDASRVGIIAPDNPAAAGSEPLPEISVILRNNPDRLAIRDFYERAQESIFDDATGGVSPLEVGGNQGFSLLGVSGEVTVDLVVLLHGTYIAEFELTRDTYRGVFDAVVGSFQFPGGE